MILTFYSYKGGVGRSMAMANIAQAYYLAGKRVVLVDWDLEAPGLEGYFHSDKTKLEEFRQKPGVIDMLEDYKQLFITLHVAIKRSQNEILGLPAQIATAISRDKVNWEAIDQKLNQYALLDDEKIDRIIDQCKLATLEEPTTVSKIAEIIEVEISDPDLSNKIALELSPRGTFEPAFAQAFLSTYGIFSKDVISEITQKLKVLCESKPFDTAEVNLIFNEVLTGKVEKIKTDAIESSVDLDRYLQEIYPQPSSVSELSPGMWILSAGARQGPELLSEYAKKVQNFNWTDFYVSYEGEAYFEQLRIKLEQKSDIILIDSRTGISEMSGVSTRQLADKIIIVTAPNPQNLSGASSMVGSFTNERVMAARGNRSLKVYIIPSRIDLSESLHLNKFQSEYLSTIARIDESIPARYLWDNGILYIPYYNYNEELAVGVSDRPEELINTGKSPRLDMIYRNLAAFFLNDQLNLNVETAVSPKQSAPHYDLAPFEESQASVFFGRNLEVSRMLELTSTGFLLLVGPPGSGKTSLINAGLIPAIRSLPQTHPLAQTKVIQYIVGQNPIYGLAEAIIRQLQPERTPAPDQISTLAEELKSDKEFSYTVNAHAHLPFGQKYLLVLDQFEKFFQLPDSPEKSFFVQRMEYWLKSKDPFVLVSMIDSDLKFRDYPILRGILEHSLINLQVPGEIELRQMIVEPAAKSGIKIDAGLPERIINDLSTIGAGKVMILQSVMNGLWVTRSGASITHSDYDRIGGIGSAMKQYFERISGGVSESEFYKAKVVLTRLASGGVRRFIVINSLNQNEREALDPFIARGLVSILQEPSATVIALSHDALISSWPLLAKAFTADIPFNEWRYELILRLEAWENKGRLPKLLLKGSELKEAKAMQSKYKDNLTEGESDFITLSRQKAFREVFLVGIAAIGIIAIIIAGAFGAIHKFRGGNSDSMKADSLAQDTSQVNSLASAYYLSSSDKQGDINYNLEVLQKLNALGANQQQKLVFKHNVEGAINAKLRFTIRNFFNNIINHPELIRQDLADTVDFGKDKHKSREFIYSNVDKRRTAGRYTHTPIDTTMKITSDSLGITAIFRSEGNITLDRFNILKNMISLDTIRLDYNLKVQSYNYSILKSEGSPVSVEVFLCITKNEEFKKIASTVVSELSKNELLYVFTRDNFVISKDTSSAYYITRSEVRYSGNKELLIARNIKDIIEAHTPIRITLVQSGRPTPNYLSVFLYDKK